MLTPFHYTRILSLLQFILQPILVFAIDNRKGAITVLCKLLYYLKHTNMEKWIHSVYSAISWTTRRRIHDCI